MHVCTKRTVSKYGIRTKKISGILTTELSRSAKVVGDIICSCNCPTVHTHICRGSSYKCRSVRDPAIKMKVRVPSKRLESITARNCRTGGCGFCRSIVDHESLEDEPQQQCKPHS